MAAKGQRLTAEQRAELAAAKQGNTLTEEHKRAIGTGVRRTASSQRTRRVKRATPTPDHHKGS